MRILCGCAVDRVQSPRDIAGRQYAEPMTDEVGAGGLQQVVGRPKELARIDEMVERLAGGRGGVVVLIGPPGIGLTTLLEEAIARAATVPGVRAVHVPSGLLEGDVSAAVAASAVAGDALRGLAESVMQLVADAGGTVAPDDPRLVQAAVTALRRLSGERPLLVTVDNLPVTDGSVFTALASLAAGIVGMPVLLVVTSHVLPRSSFEESPVGPLWVRRVPPLGTADSVAVVRTTAERWVPYPVAATLAHRTGGNPGDLVALCRTLEPDRLAGVEPLPEVLPGTDVTAATYRAWWTALGAKERMLVLGAAVAVTPDRAMLEECADAALGEVLGPDGDQVLVEVDGLVRSRDPRLLSAVRALTPARELRATLTTLAGCFPEDSLDRCRLAVRAGEPVTPAALDTLLTGARALLDRGEAETALTLVGELLQRPGSATPPLELLLLGGAAAMYCGHSARAVTLLTAALTEAPDELGRIFPLLLVAMTYRDHGPPHRLVASCLPRVDQDPVAGTAIAALAARLSAEYGQDEDAGRYLRQAQALLAEGGAEEPVPGLALTRAMVEREPSVMASDDALAGLGVRRPGTDVAGWLLEVQGLGQLIESRDWSQARGAISDLRARVQRFPAPLLRAHLALAAMTFHLAMGEYRRADDIAASAVEERLPLHVPHGGAGIALLAQVALTRGHAAAAERWLGEVGELAQLVPATPVLTAAHHEALGLRARLTGDLPAATEHYQRALRTGRVLPSTLVDLAHLLWRTGELDDALARALDAHGGDPALAAAVDLLHAPAEDAVETVTAVTRRIRDAVLPAHEALLLELAADRVGAAPPEQPAPSGSAGSATAPDPEHRTGLLRRARDLYARAGAGGRVAAVEREIVRLERSAVGEDADLGSLTADELTIARLVHRGATNKDVAHALYVSVRTVELRLTSIYRKLGIGSRRELRQLAGLATDGSPS